LIKTSLELVLNALEQPVASFCKRAGLGGDTCVDFLVGPYHDAMVLIE
jgi:hypothetical protein